MNAVQFSIPGRLKGKGRPRAMIRSRRGGQQFVQVYTDSDTVSAESMVRKFAAQAMDGNRPFDGPLILDVTISLNRPASWSKRRRAETFHATGRPDLDNIVKLIGDALNGIVWGDDAQLCEVRVRRIYNDLVGESALIRCYQPALEQATPLFGAAA